MNFISTSLFCADSDMDEIQEADPEPSSSELGARRMGGVIN